MQQDILLELLISRVERSSMRFSVILSVGGTIVEGDVVSEREYFEEVASLIKSVNPDTQETFASVPDLMDHVAMRGLDEGRDPEITREFRENVSNSYVHLKNSVLWVEGEQRNMSGSLWRGKLDAVDGFWLGRTG